MKKEFPLPIQMYRNYIQRRKYDYARLTSELGSELALEDFKRLGHQLRGNAASFGFSNLAQLGEEMENLNIARLKIHGQRILDTFHAWIVNADKQYESL